MIISMQNHYGEIFYKTKWWLPGWPGGEEKVSGVHLTLINSLLSSLYWCTYFPSFSPLSCSAFNTIPFPHIHSRKYCLSSFLFLPSIIFLFNLLSDLHLISFKLQSVLWVLIEKKGENKVNGYFLLGKYLFLWQIYVININVGIVMIYYWKLLNYSCYF